MSIEYTGYHSNINKEAWLVLIHVHVHTCSMRSVNFKVFIHLNHMCPAWTTGVAMGNLRMKWAESTLLTIWIIYWWPFWVAQFHQWLPQYSEELIWPLWVPHTFRLLKYKRIITSGCGLTAKRDVPRVPTQPYCWEVTPPQFPNYFIFSIVSISDTHRMVTSYIRIKYHHGN